MSVDGAGWRTVRAAAALAAERLGDRFESAYAIGSLAHGGFAPAVSDLDLALLTGSGGPGIGRLVDEVSAEVARAHPLGERLSVFHAPWPAFSDPPPESRFPPIDRFDLMRYGVLVHGRDLRAVHGREPTAGEIRAQAVDSALRRVAPAQLAEDLRALGDGGVSVHDATKVVLWPVRLQHVCDIGEATGNADAVAHYLELPDANHRALVRDALAWRALAAVPEPGRAMARIAREIGPLHAEILRRVSGRPDVPRGDELAALAKRLG